LINFALQAKYRNIFKKLFIGILGAVGTIIVITFTGYQGAGLTPDSVVYISVARNLTANQGFVNYDGVYFVLQPPLYPILLALLKFLTSIDPLISASYLNSFLFGLNVYISGIFLLKHLKSFALVCLGTISVLFSFTLIKVSFMALSETLFISLLLIFLYNIETYQRKRKLLPFILISVSAALACLTRYTGVVLLFTGMICILLWGRNIFKERIGEFLSFTIVASLPIGGWIIRNYFLSNTLIGQRAVSSYTLFENINFFWNTLLPWYLPLKLSDVYLGFILLIITIWILFVSDREKISKILLLKQIGPSLLFTILYSGVIIISSTTTAYDKISDRLLAPIYIPIIFVLFITSDRILSWPIQSFNLRLIAVPFSIAMLLFIKEPLENTKHFIGEYEKQPGLGYSSSKWKKSEMINYLIKYEPFSKSYSMYSNKPEAVYILANLICKRSPAKTFYNSPQSIKLDQLQSSIRSEDENIFLVWFKESNYNFLFTLDELQKNIRMKEVVHLKDGDIYTFLKHDLN